MSEPVSRERLEVAREVAMRIFRDRHFSATLPENLDGAHPIVVAEPAERLDEVCRRLEQVGPHSTVVFRRDGTLVILHVEGPFA